ncbi:hypothetical protein DWG95_13450 [Escherichia coli]|nr:hypothetical protein [Escherichia coli]EFO1628650.1 hypothetical protein [Escherichia coli]
MNTSSVFYALTDIESDSEGKETGGKVTKQNACRLAKTTPPEGGVFNYGLSLSNQSPLAISFNPSTGR